jgi:hypothetical protein
MVLIMIHCDYIYVSYAILNAMNEDIMNNIPITIVAINKVFSNPLRVLQLDTESLDPPPKAPPAPASDCCKSTDTISITAKTIWIIGRMVCISIDVCILA